MAQPNGHAPDSNSELTSANVLHGLEVIHNPATTNETRKQATEYLDQLKSSPSALRHALSLCADPSQPALVRHYGLSILEHSLRRQSHDLSDEENAQLRNSIIELGQSIAEDDPLFIRNKIAELWIELAKRSWALDWYDLDQLLCSLWSQGLVHKEFVLTVLENLSEDIFAREDPTAVLRGSDLHTAVVEIFTSKADFSGGIKIGESTQYMRHGEEGWLWRISQHLEAFLNSSSRDVRAKATAIKALATFRSAFGWIMSPAISTADCLRVSCNCLTQTDEEITIAALDTLIALYSRVYASPSDTESLVFPLMQPTSVDILRELYTRSIVGADEIYDQKYAISKKLAEIVSLLSDALIHQNPPRADLLDVAPFLGFVIEVAGHESPIVSIAAVHAWVKLLEVPLWRRSPSIAQYVAPLLNVVCGRLLLYDQFPDDANEPAVTFVNEEIEIHPERMGFYNNYKKLCALVIEWICYTHLEQALDFLLVQVSKALDEVAQAESTFNPHDYHRMSLLTLRAESQFSIVDASFRGLERWRIAHKNHPPAEVEQTGQQVREKAKVWAAQMLSKYKFRDPQIRQRQIKTAVETSSRVLPKDTEFAFNVLEIIMGAFIPTLPDAHTYSEAVIELHSYATGELRKLATYHADYFATFYDQLSSKFTDLISQQQVEPKIQVDLKSILFLVIQRATSVDIVEQRARLWSFLEPLSSSWGSENIQKTLSSFGRYIADQNFDSVGPFLQSINADNVEDWSAVSTPDEGVRLQRDMQDSFLQLPLRETRVLLGASTERLEQDSALHTTMCDLWQPMIGPILQGVLRVVTYNHQLHDPTQWPNIQPGQQSLVQRLLRDRYWQSGISEGSMNAFHSKVKSTKASLEGFASSIRGRVRNNLEQCYSIIHTLGRLGARFYSLPDVPEMIAQTLLGSAGPLNPHHLAILFAMLPKLMEECPPEYRQQFLTPIMSELLVQMDSKLSAEWQKVDEQKQNKHDEENLSDEMREDSVLRQTTYRAVNLVSNWLEPNREAQLSTKKSIVNGAHLTNGRVQSMRDFVLSNRRVLEPLLMFMTHSLTYKDTKAAQTMMKPALSIVPQYASNRYLRDEEAAAVREFISTEMLKAAITSLNDGYFADYQQYYAQLIALIWSSYGLPTHVPAVENQAAHERPPLTQTPRDVLLSLPNMTEDKVNAAAEQLLREGPNPKTKKLRAIMLSLLEGVRGVRISELYKLDTKQQRSKILEKYRQRESLGMQGVDEGQKANGNDGVDLGGVADMFGQG